MQNGIGNVEQLVAAYGSQAVLGGGMTGGGTRIALGLVEHVLPVEAVDLERGLMTEVEAVQGEIVRRAARHGIAVPSFEIACAALRANNSQVGP